MNEERKAFRFRRLSVAAVSALILASAVPTVCMAGLTKTARMEADFGTVAVADSSKAIATADGRIVSDFFPLKEYRLDPSLRYLHGMYYEAEITEDCVGRNVDTGRKVSLKKGSKTIVLKPCSAASGGECLIRTAKRETVRASWNKLRFTKYIVNPSSAYTDAQVEQWVNFHKITSPTDYLFFVSKYNQRLWIMKRNGKKWKAVDSQRVSTGGTFSVGGYYNQGYPNDVYGYNHCRIYTYMGVLASVGNERAVSYSSKGGGNCIHPQSPLGRPGTHGCVGVSRKWFYDVLLNDAHDGIRNKYKNARVVLF